MFTGIVEATGVVTSSDRRDDVVRLRIATPTGDLPVGGSIAVNGCCLTATAVAPDGFACELTEETLRRTAFGERLRPGARVNLERPMRADGRFDGHVVQGHVDACGAVVRLTRSGSAAELEIATPPEVQRYLVEKGSIAVDGISLTVASLLPAGFTVAVIPYTLERTNLAEARAGDRVNLEIDVIAKYVERLLTAARS